MTLALGSENSQALESGSAHAVNIYVGKIMVGAGKELCNGSDHWV